MKQDINQPLANQLKIVHALPGRLRLRLDTEEYEQNLKTESGSVPPLTVDSLFEIAQYLQQQEGVKSVQVKQTTNSLVVIFDPQTMTMSQLKESLSPFNLSSISPNSSADVTQPSGEKLVTQVLSLIPLLLGWLVVKRFNLSGWKAIATYLLATGIIGETIEQLQEKLSSSPITETISDHKAEPQNFLLGNGEKELDCQIVHYIPGRIRLSIPKIRQQKDYGQKLQDLLEQDARITKVQVKPTTGSVVINYLPEAFEDLNETELTLTLSNWLGLIDSAIARESYTLVTEETQNTLERDGDLSEKTFPYNE